MRLLAWEKLSPNAREWHSSPAPGSEKKESGASGGGALSAPAVEVAEDSSSLKKETPTPPPPPHEHFCLVLLDIDAVDHVDLEKDERTLWELSAEGEGWKSRVVWP